MVDKKQFGWHYCFLRQKVQTVPTLYNNCNSTADRLSQYVSTRSPNIDFVRGTKGRAGRQALMVVDLGKLEENLKEEEVDLEEVDAMAAGAVEEESVSWEGLSSMIKTTIIMTKDEITTMGLIWLI